VKQALLKLGLPTLSRHQPEGPFGLLSLTLAVQWWTDQDIHISRGLGDDSSKFTLDINVDLFILEVA
jgi:hypothetical protein